MAVGRLSRNGPANLTLDAEALHGATGSSAAASATLEVVVEAVGRSNQGLRCDTKGLSSPDVRWNGEGLVSSSLLCSCYPSSVCQSASVVASMDSLINEVCLVQTLNRQVSIGPLDLDKKFRSDL